MKPCESVCSMFGSSSSFFARFSWSPRFRCNSAKGMAEPVTDEFAELLAELMQVAEAVNTGVVAVGPFNAKRVVAY